MKRYLFISSGGHVLLLIGWITSGALLSKPRMSYYAVDLASSLPPGGAAGGGAGEVAEVADVQAPKAPPLPAPVVPRKLPAAEVIKIKDKDKAKPARTPKVEKKRGLNLKAALAALDSHSKGPARRGAGDNAGASGGGGSGIVADAGPAFPYPWYLKAIADRLNKQWQPPQNFQEDTLCQIAFVIHRDGQVTGTAIEKESGDRTFDQLAERAVLYSNPLPPLPSGFPDETLRVHMKFVGKPE